MQQQQDICYRMVTADSDTIHHVSLHSIREVMKNFTLNPAQQFLTQNTHNMYQIALFS